MNYRPLYKITTRCVVKRRIGGCSGLVRGVWWGVGHGLSLGIGVWDGRLGGGV